MDTEQLTMQQSESVKLIKGSKGYNWEIKLLQLDLDRLEDLNKEMKRRFAE